MSTFIYTQADEVVAINSIKSIYISRDIALVDPDPYTEVRIVQHDHAQTLDYGFSTYEEAKEYFDKLVSQLKTLDNHKDTTGV